MSHSTIDLANTRDRIAFAVVKPYDGPRGIPSTALQDDFQVGDVVLPVAPEFGSGPVAVDQQVQIPVPIEIGKRRRSGRTGAGDTQIVLGKVEVPIVEKQLARTAIPGGKEDILIAIVVHVTAGHPHETAAEGLLEGERTGATAGLFEHAQGACIGTYQVEVPITIEITERRASFLIVQRILVDGDVPGKGAALVDEQVRFGIGVRGTGPASIEIHVTIRVQIGGRQILTVPPAGVDIHITVAGKATFVEVDPQTKTIVLEQQVEIAIRIVVDPGHSLGVARIELRRHGKPGGLPGDIPVNDHQTGSIDRQVDPPVIVEIPPDH